MTLNQVWGALIIFVFCPLLGGLPLIGWIAYGLTGRKLNSLGTGNLSVSAAFYHGGRLVGILAVLSEALKGVAAVLLARYFFPANPEWEMIALIALVMGRYWVGSGAGTTNVVWGYTAHDPIAAMLVFLIGGISFTIFRQREQGRIGILILFPLITALRHPQESGLIGAAIVLAVLLGWIYTKIPDDLDLQPEVGQASSRSVFQFFRGDRGIRTLNEVLDPGKVGHKTATLADLKRLGYPVPMGWVLMPGDDPAPLLDLVEPSPRQPLVVRSSAIGEDTATASAAGQYETLLSITQREELLPAILRCLDSYNTPAASQYRRDRGLPEMAMAVLVQQQVQGVFSGVAFSRDPIARQGEDVVIEALPGAASRVVSGQVTPESYRVTIPDAVISPATARNDINIGLANDYSFPLEGEGDTPPDLIQQVAVLTRRLESHYYGVPQDVEWSYDGQQLWLLQTRPITTLSPIWTRKIAAEVIPGLICPLTWSINQPLTCGVWGDLFTLVLGNQASALNFNETATLHNSRAYFNATLLGQIFRRMGLPPESLEFLTRGAAMSKPPLRSTLRNVPGLLRLWQRERQLERDFQRDYQTQLAPTIAELTHHPAAGQSSQALLPRIELILAQLKTATYYSILAPLSAALRKALGKVSDEQIDNSDTPEVAAMRSLQALALSIRQDLGADALQGDRLDLATLTRYNRKIPEQFDQWLQQYGYLSEVGTDIAVPTWREAPQPLESLFLELLLHPVSPAPIGQTQKRDVQQRFRLKGRVTEVYSRLLAELRWSFVALEQYWLDTAMLHQPGDIFFLEFWEVKRLVELEATLKKPDGARDFATHLGDRIAQRKTQFEQDKQLEFVPFLVYGIDPPEPIPQRRQAVSKQLQGIGASAGQVEGRIRVVHSLATLPELDRETIVVVPYTDSGWAPLLAKAGGLIAEVGGRLSHGAIVAREYRIPAVMDIHNATNLLRDGQRVRIDGQQGTVEVLTG